MNKKGYIGIILIIGILIIGVIFVYAKSGHSLNLFNFGNNTQNEMSGCPTGIIPENVTIILNIGLNLQEPIYQYDIIGDYWKGSHPIQVRNKWGDGSQIGKYSGYETNYCHIGSSKGENINYVYCEVNYSKSETAVSNEGVIGDTKESSYKINLVLIQDSFIDKTMQGDFLMKGIANYNVVGATCK